MTGFYDLKFFTVTAKLIFALKPKNDVLGAHAVIVKVWLCKSFYLKTFNCSEKNVHDSMLYHIPVVALN